MSASREKKQRQDDPNQGLTQKQIKERKEAAIKKRNTVIYTVIGVVVAVLVVALLVWNSGFFQSRTVAMTINGRDYSPAEVSYYYGQTKQSYGYYLSMMGYDSTKSDRDQVVDEESGKTFYDLFMEQAKATMIKERDSDRGEPGAAGDRPGELPQRRQPEWLPQPEQLPQGLLWFLYE